MLNAGYNHSCAITEDGYIYTWGDNSISSCGTGKTNEMIDILEPRLVESLAGVRVVQAAFGHSHSLITSLELQKLKTSTKLNVEVSDKKESLADVQKKEKQHLILLKTEERIFNERVKRIKRLQRHLNLIFKNTTNGENKVVTITEYHKEILMK